MIDFHIGPTGIWLCRDISPHTFDEPLAEAISDFLVNQNAANVLDVGCGSGAYVKHLRKRGIVATGIDGNPNTPLFCSGCEVLDLALGFDGFASDWVLCLEVGEHLPKQYESDFLANLSKASTVGIILSWFPYEGEGIGHVNPQSNDYIIVRMGRLGFEVDGAAIEHFRAAATQWWFKESLMVFQRR